MTLSELEAELEASRPNGLGPGDRDSLILEVAEGLLDKILLSRHAAERVPGDTTGLSATLAGVRRARVLELVRDDVVAGVRVDPPREAQIFDWLGEEVRVRHVLTRTEEDARGVLAELEGGGKLESLVAEHSVDPFTRSEGGLMSWMTYGDAAELDEAVFPLEVGQVAGPVRTRRGWHVARLEDRRSHDRERTTLNGAAFVAHHERRLREERWRGHLRKIWDERDASWNEVGVEVSRTRFEAHVARVDSLHRALNRLSADGDDVTERRAAIPTGPELEPAEARIPVLEAAGEVVLTMSDVVDVFREAKAQGGRPVSFDRKMWEHWLRPHAAARLALHDARARGFISRPEVVKALESAVSFHLVSRFYEHAIVGAVEPSDDDVRAFYEKHREHFLWRPDLDVAVLVGPDTSGLNAARTRLKAGDPFDEVSAEFIDLDDEHRAFRTGMKRSFPELTGLDDVIRALDDERGSVSRINSLEDGLVLVRIEDVGEQSSMTFADAYEFAREACVTEMRELRMRTILDSLRTVHGASIDASVVLQADPFGEGS